MRAGRIEWTISLLLLAIFSLICSIFFQPNIPSVRRHNRTLEWQEEPFQKVRGYKDLRDYVAEVWVTGQKGDRFEASREVMLTRGRRMPMTVSLVRTDGTRQTFRTVVHHPEWRDYDNIVPIKIFHLVVNGKEVDSFAP